MLRKRISLALLVVAGILFLLGYYFQVLEVRQQRYLEHLSHYIAPLINPQPYATWSLYSFIAGSVSLLVAVFLLLFKRL